jgi:P27 family predicted phage terminase small subunit
MPANLYTGADVPVLAAFCEAWADHVRATEELAVGSLTTARGGKSPLVQIRNDAAHTMAALGTRLGLSPADRANLRMPAEDMGGKWAGLIG